MITHTAFFGTAEHAFCLNDDIITELERLTDTGIGAFYQRVIAMHFNAADLAEIIRLGLIGAGMHPQEAMQLVNAYARNRPMAETFPLALDILDARWTGTAAPATGDTAE
tara:strand:- start:138250 stop:138579 length:330 start_codon:yes stop_codon:yes gene_type:complete